MSKSISVRRIVGLGIAATLAASSFVAISAGAASADSNTLQWAADAASLGAIPDGTDPVNCGVPGVPRTVTFPVSGLTGGALDVRVLGLTLSHSYMGDVSVTLVSPSGASVLLFGNVRAEASDTCGDSSNFGGAYDFADDAPGNLWAAALAAADTSATVAPGAYRASAAGDRTAAPGATGTPVSITAPFASDALNGTWKLNVTDGGTGDTGMITAATLQIVDSKGAVITAGPTATTQAKPKFAFYFDRPAAMECSLSAAGTPAGYNPCTGPTSYQPSSDLPDGKYVFSVRPRYTTANLPGAVTSQEFTIGSQACVTATNAVTSADAALTAGTAAATAAAARVSSAQAALSSAGKALSKVTKALKAAEKSKKLSKKAKAATVKALKKQLKARTAAKKAKSVTLDKARSAVTAAQLAELPLAVLVGSAAKAATASCASN